MLDIIQSGDYANMVVNFKYPPERISVFFNQITPPLDVESVSQTLKQKNILPSALKFGFLGLGIMGSGIVKNLLNSGHSVIVWNRSPDKVRPMAVLYWWYAGFT
jgi:hypothetical protein